MCLRESFFFFKLISLIEIETHCTINDNFGMSEIKSTNFWLIFSLFCGFFRTYVNSHIITVPTCILVYYIVLWWYHPDHHLYLVPVYNNDYYNRRMLNRIQPQYVLCICQPCISTEYMESIHLYRALMQYHACNSGSQPTAYI